LGDGWSHHQAHTKSSPRDTLHQFNAAHRKRSVRLLSIKIKRWDIS
jgi:hypothetical protein